MLTNSKVDFKSITLVCHLKSLNNPCNSERKKTVSANGASVSSAVVFVVAELRDGFVLSCSSFCASFWSSFCSSVWSCSSLINNDLEGMDSKLGGTNGVSCLCLISLSFSFALSVAGDSIVNFFPSSKLELIASNEHFSNASYNICLSTALMVSNLNFFTAEDVPSMFLTAALKLTTLVSLSHFAAHIVPDRNVLDKETIKVEGSSTNVNRALF